MRDRENDKTEPVLPSESRQELSRSRLEELATELPFPPRLLEAGPSGGSYSIGSNAVTCLATVTGDSECRPTKTDADWRTYVCTYAAGTKSVGFCHKNATIARARLDVRCGRQQ